MSRDVKKAVIDAGCLISGHFVFADGDHATKKIEMDHLWENQKSLKTVLAALAEAKGLPGADIILGVPEGGQRLADVIGSEYLGLPVISLVRVPGGAKQDFQFETASDQFLAEKARSPRIYEDVVSTLSSIAGVVKLLDPDRQDIHSLAIWRRGEVKAKYVAGITDHYLVEEEIRSFPPEKCPVCHR